MNMRKIVLSHCGGSQEVLWLLREVLRSFAAAQLVPFSADGLRSKYVARYLLKGKRAKLPG